MSVFASFDRETRSAAGEDLKAKSDDVSEREIPIRFQVNGVANILGSREKLSMEVFLGSEIPPVRVQAKQIWAFVPSEKGAVSGWEYTELKGRFLRRFRTFVDRTDRRAIPEVET